jgi:hypothetical protein
MCEEHDLPEVQVVTDDGREPWELGCPICNAAELDARRNGRSDEATEEEDSQAIEDLAEQVVEATEET